MLKSYFTHFENEDVGSEAGGDYDSKGENGAEHVPEAQGVCRKPHWPGKINRNNEGDLVFLRTGMI